MIKSNKKGSSSIWVGLMTVAILACLGGIGYTFYMIQQEASEDGESRMVADELRILSQTVSLRLEKQSRDFPQHLPNCSRTWKSLVA